MQTPLFNIPMNSIVMPCRNIRKTSAYGVKRKLKATNGKLIDDVHNGVDFVGDKSLMAIADGKVLFLTDNDGTGAKTIITAHGGILPNRYVMLNLYTHCDSFVGNLKQNDKVIKGHIIANMGATGNVTAVHVHVAMYAIPPEVWHDVKTDKWYQWDYNTRDQYQINPSWILGL